MEAIKKIEQEVNNIRLQIYEETRTLTPAQRSERTNKAAEAMHKNSVSKLSHAQKKERFKSNFLCAFFLWIWHGFHVKIKHLKPLGQKGFVA